MRGRKTVNSKQGEDGGLGGECTVCRRTWRQEGGSGAGGRSTSSSSMIEASRVQEPYQFKQKTPVKDDRGGGKKGDGVMMRECCKMFIA